MEGPYSISCEIQTVMVGATELENSRRKRASTDLSPRQKYVQGLFHAGSGVANPDLSDATSGEADTMSFLLGANEVTARSTSANTTAAKSGSAIALGKRLLGEQ